MNDYAKIDNALSASQTDIGESSNLAQIAQTYACNFTDQKYEDAVCILSVLAQVAIDNAKRRFDIDLTNEIKRIKNDLNIKENKYPSFWMLIKQGFNRKNINPSLKCPMNYLYTLKLPQFHSTESTLPMSYYFNKFPLDINRKTCKKVEEFITSYSLDLYKFYSDGQDINYQDFILLKSNYDKMLKDISTLSISKNYLGLYSWLIDRCFLFTPQLKGKVEMMKSSISKNKSLLFKVLYDINKQNLLKILSKNL